MPCYDYPPFNYVHERASEWGNKIGAVAGHKLGGEIATAPFNQVSSANFLQMSFVKIAARWRGTNWGEKLPPRRLIESHQQMVCRCQL